MKSVARIEALGAQLASPPLKAALTLARAVLIAGTATVAQAWACNRAVVTTVASLAGAASPPAEAVTRARRGAVLPCTCSDGWAVELRVAVTRLVVARLAVARLAVARLAVASVAVVCIAARLHVIHF